MHYPARQQVARTSTGGFEHDEVWLFAQQILGNRIPERQAATTRSQQVSEGWKFAASISNRARTALLCRQANKLQLSHDREMLQWLEQVSERQGREHRSIAPSDINALTAQRDARNSNDADSLLAEWNEADHPRAPKGISSGGQWVKKGGSSGGTSRSHFGSNSEPERVLTHIRRSSGDKWSGDGVLDVMGRLAPQWLPFIKKHLALSLTSAGATEPATTVRQGEFGTPVQDLPRGPFREQGPFSIHFEIPTGWNDLQAAQYILSQMADDLDVHRVAADWAVDRPELLRNLQDERFKNGLETVAALAGGYYTALASLSLGGEIAVAAWDIQNGDYLGAALNVACLLPIGGILKGAIEASGTIAIKVGDDLAGLLPMATIAKIQKLAPEQAERLSARLLTAKTADEVAEIVTEFIGPQFHLHHPLPKFLGGFQKQLLAKIPVSVHKEFHAVLREELRAAGFPLNIGGPGGGTREWVKLLTNDSSRQGKAFDAVLKTSRAMDAKHGTDITSWVWQNLVGENFVVLPR